MKIQFEGINATMTTDQIDKICDKVESQLKTKHNKRWHSMIEESIEERTKVAGHEKRTADDIGNGYAEVLPTITKEYTKFFVRQALIEIFCDNDK